MPIHRPRTSSTFRDIDDIDTFRCIADQCTCQLPHHTRLVSRSTSIPRSRVTHQSPQTTFYTHFNGPKQPVHRYRRDHNGMMESPGRCFIGPRSDLHLGITGTCDIADERFSTPLRHVTGWTLRCFVLCWFLLLVTLGNSALSIYHTIV